MNESKVNSRTISEYFKIIQGVINRMAQNSFMIKTWYATLFGAIIIFSFNIVSILVYFILIVISVIFWFIDSYFLHREKLFRKLYTKKVEEFNDDNKRNEIKLFDLDVNPYKKEVKGIVRIMFTKTEICYYLIFIIINSILLIFSFNPFGIGIITIKNILY
ncbi:MAG: hypothetical protein ACTSVV_00035 [Promethearchaeota archaeon]